MRHAWLLRLAVMTCMALALVGMVFIPAQRARAYDPTKPPQGLNGLVPASFDVTLSPGQSAEQAEHLTIPTGLPSKVDLVIAVDTTGSMGGEIDALKSNINSMISELTADGKDVAIAVVSFEDYPLRGDGSTYDAWYGAQVDEPYHVDLPVSTDAGAVQNAVSALVAGNGSDLPQDYARVMWEASQGTAVPEATTENKPSDPSNYWDHVTLAAQPALGYRSDPAQKILLMFGDSIPHDVSLNTGKDPGRDAHFDTPDDITLAGAEAAMRTANTKLVMVYSGDYNAAWELARWQEIASQTGGNVAQINSDGTIPSGVSLAQLVRDQIAQLPPRVNITSSCPDGSGASILFSYAGGTDVTTITTSDVTPGSTFDFTEKVSLAANAPTGTDVSCSVAATGMGWETVTIHVPNMPPVVQPLTGATINEGSAYTASGSFSDPDSTSWTATVDYGDGSGVQGLALDSVNKTFALSHTYADNGTYTVTVTVADDSGTSGATSAIVTVNNVAPTVTSLTVPIDPVPINTAVNVSGAFTDPGTADTHTASWDWGDGTTGAGTVTEASGSVTGTHSYAASGLYTVKLTVTDKDSGVGDLSAESYIVVYDPSAGFVTGGGWINSPAGAYAADPTLTGRANFGFVAKYQKGAAAPTGQTQFQFQAGNLNFHSSSYQWLVVAGAKGQFKGVGTLNGAENYGFMLTAVDGQINGGGGVDTFRIKIWDVASGNVVYDNQMGAADSGIPTTTLGGGSIVIHS